MPTRSLKRLEATIDMEARHDSVLMQEVLEALDVQASDTVVDATLGGAGHVKALLAALGEGGVIIGIDADSAAVERARAVMRSTDVRNVLLRIS